MICQTEGAAKVNLLIALRVLARLRVWVARHVWDLVSEVLGAATQVTDELKFRPMESIGDEEWIQWGFETTGCFGCCSVCVVSRRSRSEGLLSDALWKLWKSIFDYL